jgi:uncharacterized membrane protein YgcG
MPAAFVPAAEAHCVYVGGMSFDATAADVQRVAARFGKVVKAHLELNNNHTPAGFGYVEFASAAEAQKAIADTEAFKALAKDKPHKGEKPAERVANEAQAAARPFKVLAYTPALNYRNPDGSRKRSNEKKLRKREEAQVQAAQTQESRPRESGNGGRGGGFGGRGGGRGGFGAGDRKFGGGRGGGRGGSFGGGRGGSFGGRGGGRGGSFGGRGGGRGGSFGGRGGGRGGFGGRRQED